MSFKKFSTDENARQDSKNTAKPASGAEKPPAAVMPEEKTADTQKS